MDNQTTIHRPKEWVKRRVAWVSPGNIIHLGSGLELVGAAVGDEVRVQSWPWGSALPSPITIFSALGAVTASHSSVAVTS